MMQPFSFNQAWAQDSLSELLLRWEEQYQQGIDLSPEELCGG